MTVKLSKAEETDKAKLAADTAAARDKLETAVDTYNAGLTALNETLQAAVDEYNSTLEDVASFADGIAADAEAEIEDRSERWQEGDAGQAAKQFAEVWRELANKAEAIEIDMPGELEQPDGGDLPGELDDAPTEPE